MYNLEIVGFHKKQKSLTNYFPIAFPYEMILTFLGDKTNVSSVINIAHKRHSSAEEWINLWTTKESLSNKRSIGNSFYNESFMTSKSSISVKQCYPQNIKNGKIAEND